MIEPALSPEEWATWQLLEAGKMIGGRFAGKYGGYAHASPEKKAKLAALCLHGRITGDMVDALRLSGEHWRKEQGNMSEPAERGGWCARQAIECERAADLLESLLPPRSTTND